MLYGREQKTWKTIIGDIQLNLIAIGAQVLKLYGQQWSHFIPKKVNEKLYSSGDAIVSIISSTRNLE